MFRNVRILVLLLILLAVIVNMNVTRTDATDWLEPLIVSIYPMNGDGSYVTKRYIEQLDAADFSEIERFMNREVKDYDIPIDQPFKVFLQPEITDLPPTLGEERNVLGVMWWSLTMRYWSYQIAKFDRSDPDVQVFIAFFDPAKNEKLEHSTGLEKGMIGIVNAYATRQMNEPNNFVITHEILHTLGATDKYDLANGQPIYPDGFAEPNRSPLYPQRYAEIMGGRVVKSAITSEIPASLRVAKIGFQTAFEIGLLAYIE